MHWWISRFRSETRWLPWKVRGPLLLLLPVSVWAQTAKPADLTIVNAAPHQTEDGPPMPRGEFFLPGETVFYSFQISGYGETEVKKIRLSYHLEAFDPAGVRIMEPVDSIFDATLHDEDKRWMPKLRVPLAIPPVAPGGHYRIAATVTDDISHKTASVESSFTVQGNQAPPSKELTVRGFTFHRAEDDAKPLEHAAFRAGDAVFARFEIAGFRYGAGNAIHVFYDVAVLNPAGKQIYAQAHAAEDRSSSYYPKPYVPGGMNLALERTMRAGEYTVVLTAHDEIGGQRFEARYPFSVE